MAGKGHFIHGHARVGNHSPTFRSWTSMWTRCTNPKRDSWRLYGGRGITICKRWTSFEQFLKDMGERPPGTSIDRINTNGNYSPKNCRWATPKQQRHNGNGRLRIFQYNGVRKCLSDWCKELGVVYETVIYRMDTNGETFAQAIKPGSRAKKYPDISICLNCHASFTKKRSGKGNKSCSTECARALALAGFKRSSYGTRGGKAPSIGISQRPNGRWLAQIMISGKHHHLGYFATATEASNAYLTMKRRQPKAAP